ncbi:tetratricopeptide repeat protein [Providencia manganoxydans]
MYWYKRAALQGNSDAQFAMGRGYEKGNGIGKDLVSAFDWYRQGADNGSAPAAMKVAEFYEQGLGGVKADHNKAIEWYMSMADDGIPEAQIKLAELYLAGQLSDVDSQKVVSWLLASEKSNVQSKNQLALFYLTGTGVQQNEQKARELLQQSAFKDVSDAQNNLAVMYATGLGGEKNIFRAMMWFERAAKAGNSAAIANLKLLQEHQGVTASMLKYTDNVQKLIKK